jgi:antitoxin (DNA-binding transcriptional repressor) of toxin-antitoxin stability system
MKVVDLDEAKTHLEQYARECQSSPVIVTIDGQPSFELLPIRPDDDPDFIDRLLEENGEFRALMEQRRREVDEGRVSPLEEVRSRLLSD